MLDARSQNKTKTVRLMFEDEAGFGRINKPKRCWCPKGQRPSVPCHHIREYRFAACSETTFFLEYLGCRPNLLRGASPEPRKGLRPLTPCSLRAGFKQLCVFSILHVQLEQGVGDEAAVLHREIQHAVIPRDDAAHNRHTHAVILRVRLRRGQAQSASTGRCPGWAGAGAGARLSPAARPRGRPARASG